MKNTHTEYLSSERTPTVYPELEELLPALSVEEFSALEADILANGCYAPIIVNQDLVIIDGHNRYYICQKHGLPFRMQVFHFDDLLEAKQWAFQTQQGRRNLSKWSLAKIAMKLKPDLEEKAKANQGTRTDLFLNSEKSSAPVNTTKELARSVGIGTDTMSKAIRIKESNLPALEAALDDGTISIHKGYNIVKRIEQLPEDQRKQAAEVAVQAVKSGEDAAWDENGDYIPTDFYNAIEQDEIKEDMAGNLLQIMMQTPPEDRDEMSERMIRITQDVYEKDRRTNADAKNAKIFIDGFYRAGLVEATLDNIRRYVKFTGMDEEDIEIAVREAYDISKNFKAIGDILKNEFLPRHWKDHQEIIDVESRDAS